MGRGGESCAWAHEPVSRGCTAARAFQTESHLPECVGLPVLDADVGGRAGFRVTPFKAGACCVQLLRRAHREGWKALTSNEELRRSTEQRMRWGRIAPRDLRQLKRAATNERNGWERTEILATSPRRAASKSCIQHTKFGNGRRIRKRERACRSEVLLCRQAAASTLHGPSLQRALKSPFQDVALPLGCRTSCAGSPTDVELPMPSVRHGGRPRRAVTNEQKVPTHTRAQARRPDSRYPMSTNQGALTQEKMRSSPPHPARDGRGCHLAQLPTPTSPLRGFVPRCQAPSRTCSRPHRQASGSASGRDCARAT